MRRERQAAADATSTQPAPTAVAEPSKPTTQQPEAQPEPTPTPPPSAPLVGAQPSYGALPSKDELNGVWSSVLETMSGRVRSRFSAGRFLDTTDNSVVFGLPNPVHRDRCEEVREEVDHALAARFVRPIPLVLVVDATEDDQPFFGQVPSGGAGPVSTLRGPSVDDDELVDVHDLVDANDAVPSVAERILATFAGSELIEDPTNPSTHR